MIITNELYGLNELMWKTTVEGISGTHAAKMDQSSQPILLAWSWYRARKRSKMQPPPAVTKPVLIFRVETPSSR
jgi:hypothetical protein